MSTATIDIPADHIGPVHQSLLSRRDILGRVEDPAVAREVEAIEVLISQMEGEGAPDTAGRRLTGSREALWTAIYDSTCATAEQVAECCNEYWRNADIESARREISLLSARLDLLEKLGQPPMD
jgi:hypothetical protein